MARLWLWTLRIEIVEHPACASTGARPWVLAFFHGQQFALLGWRRRTGRKTAVLVSLSKDGDLQAAALPRLGLVVRRGSTSRGGVKGLASIVRLLKQPAYDAAFAVDGPRGPYGVVHPGALAAARHAGGLVVPLASASARSKVLTRAWDAFELPRPFSRVVVAIAEPVAPEGFSSMDALAEHVRAQIWAMRRLAEERVRGA